MQRSWRETGYWLAPHDFLSPPSYRTQDEQPFDGPTQHGLGTPLLITKGENTLQVDFIEEFPQLRLLPL